MRIRCPTTVSTASTSSRSVARRAREREHRKRQKEQHSRRRADADADADARQNDDHPETRRGRAEHASSSPLHAYPGGRHPMATKQELRQARMRQLREEAAARRAEEQSSSPLKRGWQFIYNNFMPAFGFASSGDTGDGMPAPPETPTRSRPKKTYNTPGAFPGMTIDSDTESSSPANSNSKSPDVEMSDETQSPLPSGPGSAKATSPDSASFSSTTPSSSSGNRSSFYAFPSTSSAATSTEDFFASRSHTCNSANCTGGYYYTDPDNSFRVFHDCHFAGNEEEMFSREEKEAERSRKRAEDRRKREEEEHERERMRRDAEKERWRRREAEEREQLKRQREEQEQERKQREKREQDEADYRYVETIFAPIAALEMQQAKERGETEEQLRARQWRIWEEWDALVNQVRRQREEKERLEREREREERRRKEREEKARKEREESERRQREQHKDNRKPKSKSSSSKQSRPHPYARSTNSNRKRGGLHFEPSDDPFERPPAAGGGDSPFTRGCRRPNFRKPNFGANRAKANAASNSNSNSKPTAPSSPTTPAATPGAGPSSKKKYSKDPTSYFEWYESEWMSINSLQPAARPLTFKDIPWALVQMPSLPDQVTSTGVKAFMASRHSSSSSSSPLSSSPSTSTGMKKRGALTLREKRAAAKRELMNWHPDKFATRVLGRVVDPVEREAIRAAADVVQKALTEYMREPDGVAAD
ncbi:hypothetical protein ACEPAH_9293 [Sanghuangporus vaninii]